MLPQKEIYALVLFGYRDYHWWQSPLFIKRTEYEHLFWYNFLLSKYAMKNFIIIKK